VSGSGAALAIMEALQELATDPEMGVIIVARGGGDATQLLPFSDEELCRAIAACPVPVISAIGHESDRPLCDEVADLRCGTPSLAAAAIVPDRQSLHSDLERAGTAARSAVQLAAEASARRLAAVDTFGAVRAGAVLATGRLSRAEARVRALHPRRQLAECSRRLGGIDSRRPAVRAAQQARGHLLAVDWRRPATNQLLRSADRLAADARHLAALSPARVLHRGYAVVRRKGSVVRRAGQVAPGQAVDVQLAAGRLAARVEEVADG
jgi:exodeoxyribonuclease VII large subunit